MNWLRATRLRLARLDENDLIVDNLVDNLIDGKLYKGIKIVMTLSETVLYLERKRDRTRKK